LALLLVAPRLAPGEALLASPAPKPLGAEPPLALPLEVRLDVSLAGPREMLALSPPDGAPPTALPPLDPRLVTPPLPLPVLPPAVPAMLAVLPLLVPLLVAPPAASNALDRRRARDLLPGGST